MQRLQFVLFQLDEATRHLAANTVPALRVSLLLLDNAVEVLLDKWIEDDISTDDYRQTFVARARKAGIPDNHPDFQDFFRRSFLSAQERRSLSRYFDQKIKYTSDVKRAISLDVAAVPSQLHRLRDLKPGTSGYSSSEDFDWLRQRFNISPHELWHAPTLDRVSTSHRTGYSRVSR